MDTQPTSLGSRVTRTGSRALRVFGDAARRAHRHQWCPGALGDWAILARGERELGSPSFCCGGRPPTPPRCLLLANTGLGALCSNQPRWAVTSRVGLLPAGL